MILALAVADEIIDVQERLAGAAFRRARLIDGFEEGIRGDPNHKCKGRAARGRLARVIAAADAANLEIPKIRGISKRIQKI